MEQETSTPQEPQTVKPAELTINDLNNLKALVEMAVRRGAFNASELTAVGSAYDKLNNFLTSVQADNK